MLVACPPGFPEFLALHPVLESLDVAEWHNDHDDVHTPRQTLQLHGPHSDTSTDVQHHDGPPAPPTEPPPWWLAAQRLAQLARLPPLPSVSRFDPTGRQ